MIHDPGPFLVSVERSTLTKSAYRVGGDLEGEFRKAGKKPPVFELESAGQVLATAREQDVPDGTAGLGAMARMAAGAYDVHDAAGQLLGKVAVDPRGAVLRSRIDLELADGRRLVGVEKSLGKALARRAWSLGSLVVDVPNPVRSPIVFADPSGAEVLSVEPMKAPGTAMFHVRGDGSFDLALAAFVAVLMDHP